MFVFLNASYITFDIRKFTFFIYVQIACRGTTY